ncbi:hypothetical protein CJ030_MR7G010656 [Morella rubra]|uniref:Retrotransposon gag domain-containing protein n=1 Tax=Morella rubra TaxID=262757 RepID=A0A6A1UYI2_9ROSI|nr:hypothetical protein CJ030_MR7G010656 [Morella rubra]
MAEERRLHPSPGDPETIEIPRSKRTLDFPVFNGRDPAGWLNRLQEYFTYYQTQPHLRLMITLSYLEGEHLYWPFGSMEYSRGHFRTWEAFAEAFVAWFGRGTLDSTWKQRCNSDIGRNSPFPDPPLSVTDMRKKPSHICILAREATDRRLCILYGVGAGSS